MSLIDHLRELRRRIIIVLLVIGAGSVGGWFAYPHVLGILEHPYCSVPAGHRYDGAGGRCVLVYQGVLDGFNTRLRIALLTGTVATAPIWLYQLWAFVAPGMRSAERKYARWFVATSTLLFAAGCGLAYLVLTKALNVLLSMSGGGTEALLTVNNYLSFVTTLLIVFGVAFELPLVIIMLNLARVLPASLLKKSQRVAIFLIFVFAAVATPTTDPISMCALALPLVLLFEGAVLFAVVHDRRKARRRAMNDTVPDGHASDPTGGNRHARDE